jgi:fructosamine-3-kinase
MREDSLAMYEKTDRGPGADLSGEAAGLRWLGAAEKDGGLSCARVVSATAHRLVEVRIPQGAPTREKARRAGAALARAHAAGAAWYGCPPPGWDGPGYAIGRSLTPVVSDSARDGAQSWGAACAEWRVMPHVRTIRDDGLVDAAEARLLTRVADRMAAGGFDSPEPALVRAGGHACARIHGDLWAGNLLWAADGTRAAATGAALIDPMASGGHAETDLAMLQLFGCAYLDDLLAAYDEASLLADGWRDRVAIHQLVPVLLHCVLFGGDYVGLALSIARRYA